MDRAKFADKTEMAEVFAQNIVATRYKDLPAQTVEVTKQSILDTLGVSMAGGGTVPEVRAIVELVTEGGGKPESTIWGFGQKVPAMMAAFVNGAMTHSLDYDDVIDECGVHLSATTVPAALAVAERTGGVSGREFITAIALANDMISRMAQAISARRSWFLTPLMGVFSGAAACGKVLGLGKDQLVNAFGIAFCQAAGTMEVVHGTDSSIRALYDSFVGKAGVLSALMAQRGISGVKASMEGKSGLFNAYFLGDYSSDILRGDLGRRFEGSKVSFKAWPCCRRAHPAVTALLALMRKEGIRAEEIERVVIDTNPASEALCQPPAARQRPSIPLDAKFSIPYIAANAMLKGRISLEDFAPEAIQDPRTIDLAKKIGSRLNPAYAAIAGMTPGKVELQTKIGKIYQHLEEFPYGHPQNPMSQEDLLRKFRDCVFHSATPLHADDTENLVHMLSTLESVKDMREITCLLGRDSGR